jgi:Protein of unknown function (DUF1566)
MSPIRMAWAAPLCCVSLLHCSSNTGSDAESSAQSGAGAPSSASGGNATSGGDSSSSGGNATSGASSTSGGVPSAGATGSAGMSGASSTAGASGVAGSGAGGAAGASSTCYSGATVTQANADYTSRKWARWPVPTPPSMSLPNPMKYTDQGNGTVLDNVTGLVWQQTSDGTMRTWANAISNCQNLALDGGGWTLPTRMELTSIVDDAQPSGARVNATYFKFAAKAGWTWASTPWVVDSRKVVSPPLSWFINFSAGDSNNSLDQTAASAYGRCVRVPASQVLPATHYTIASGEVTDNFTCSVWQQTGSGTTASLTWDQAVAYCASSTLNGHAWRLPSLNELASVVDDVVSGNVSPAVDHTAFPSLASNAWYWTATPYTAATDKWSLNFEDGFTEHQATSALGNALCVR